MEGQKYAVRGRLTNSPRQNFDILLNITSQSNILLVQSLLQVKLERKRKRSDSVLIKAPTDTEKSKTQHDTTKRHRNFDYTTIKRTNI